MSILPEQRIFIFSFKILQMVINLKIQKKEGNPDAFELSIAQAILELEMNSDLKAQLRELHITKAKEIDLFGKKVRLCACACVCVVHFMSHSLRLILKKFLFSP